MTIEDQEEMIVSCVEIMMTEDHQDRPKNHGDVCRLGTIVVLSEVIAHRGMTKEVIPGDLASLSLAVMIVLVHHVTLPAPLLVPVLNLMNGPRSRSIRSDLPTSILIGRE